MSETLWTKELRVDPLGKETLVIHCSDWRFVDATRAFLREHLKVQSYDLIVVPGAIHFLVSYLFPKYSWVGRRWLKFLFGHHGTKRVIAFSHADCGWYKFVHSAERWTEKLFVSQAEDSNCAAKVIADFGEGVSYEQYFVDFTGSKVTVSRTD